MAFFLVKKEVKNTSKTKFQKSRNKSKDFSSELPSSDVGPDDNKEINFNFTSVEMELLQEQLNEWKVGMVNVSQRFKNYQIKILKKAKIYGLKWCDFHEVLCSSVPDIAPTIEDEHCFKRFGGIICYGLYWSWPFLTIWLVKDKITIPLLKSNIWHFMVLKERVSKIIENYNCRTYQSGISTSPLQIQYMRDLPNSPQRKKLLR
ncbi:hypothetical protein C1646_677437 [Rhizophagus diaphanus]|nr:hypothetical protein C1646_677437 [Rhizophagus diaphanus] [Rhizophagus sp. MUCL 43196]